MAKSGRITLFTLVATGTALGVFLTSPKRRKQIRKTIGNINTTFQIGKKVAFLAEKLGIINKPSKKMVSNSAKTSKVAEKNINKVLH